MWSQSRQRRRACNRAASSALLMVLTGPGLLGQIVIASDFMSLSLLAVPKALLKPALLATMAMMTSVSGLNLPGSPDSQ
ncbi:hypothetical protein ABBQ32_008773 [Trebouxia sp. C0010 RCD-2024]